MRGEGVARLDHRVKRGAVVKIKAARIGALGLKQARAGGQIGRRVVDGVKRIAGDHFGGDVFVDDLVHEAGVGAVFQKAAHQIGQQVAMRANRGVNATAGFLGLEDDVVQGLAHAVQALEFEGRFIGGHFQNGGGGMGVMGGELRIDPVGHRQELAGIGDIADIGGGLRGEDRKALDALDLGALDLGVPIGALDEADHDLAIKPCGQTIKVVKNVAGAVAIGLNHDAKAVPARKGRLGEHGFDNIERQ